MQKKEALWKADSAKMRCELKINADFAPWTSSARLQGLPKHNCRSKDLLDLAWVSRGKAMPSTTSSDEKARDFWADVSQGVSRKPWYTGALWCATQTSLPYSFECDTVLSGYDSLRLMGAPLDIAPTEGPYKLYDRDLRSLGGEAFSVPVVTAVCYAFWLNPHAFWWGPET